LEALDKHTREQMSLLKEGHNSLLDVHQTCVLGKWEALDKRTHEQMSLLKERHNSLLDAHQTCQQQVTSLSQLCTRPQERHVEFGANSYVQPPRSKFGKK
jgi:hypothetical protein